MKIYTIGDKVWVAKAGSQEVHKTCPVCFGKLEVTLILGNGDTVTMPCDYCGKGYEQPRGYVTEYEYIVEPEQHTITACKIEQTCHGEKRVYRSGHYVLYEEDMFDTIEESTERCAQKVEQRYQEQTSRAEHLKANVHKTYAWNAGYHMREAKRNLRDAAHHQEKAKLCKAKARTDQ